MISSSAAIGRRATLEPAGEALVELRPLGLGERFVGGVANEDVAELEGVAGRSSERSGRTSSLRTSARSERPDLWPQGLVASSVDRRLLEHAADDARPLGDAARRRPAARGERRGAR